LIRKVPFFFAERNQAASSGSHRLAMAKNLAASRRSLSAPALLRCLDRQSPDAAASTCRAWFHSDSARFRAHWAFLLVVVMGPVLGPVNRKGRDAGNAG